MKALFGFLGGFLALNLLLGLGNAAIDAAPGWLLDILGTLTLLALPFALLRFLRLIWKEANEQAQR